MSKNEWLESLIRDARDLVLQPTLKGSKDSTSFDADGYTREFISDLPGDVDISENIGREHGVTGDVDLGQAGVVSLTVTGTLENEVYVDIGEIVDTVWDGNPPDPNPYIELNNEKTPIVQTMGQIYEAWKEGRKEEERRDPLLFALSAMAEVISDVKAETKQRVLDENLPAELRVFRDKEANLKEQISNLKEHIVELEGAAELSGLQAKTNQEIIKDQNDRIGRLLRQVQRLEGGE